MQDFVMLSELPDEVNGVKIRDWDMDRDGYFVGCIKISLDGCEGVNDVVNRFSCVIDYLRGKTKSFPIYLTFERDINITMDAIEKYGLDKFCLANGSKLHLKPQYSEFDQKTFKPTLSVFMIGMEKKREREEDVNVCIEPVAKIVKVTDPVYARLQMINSRFDLPVETTTAMDYIRDRLQYVTSEIIECALSLPHDKGRVIAFIDTIQHAKNIACDSIILPHATKVEYE